MLFLIAGGAKLLSVYGGAAILKRLDPVLRMPGWLLMSPAGVVEVGVGLLGVLAKGRLFPGAEVAVVVGRFDFGIALWIGIHKSKETRPRLGGVGGC